MAADFAKFNTNFEIMGGYFSPVSDAYAKKGLASSRHRLNMCNLAVDQGSNWLMVDDWEATQPVYMPTAKVLDHFDEEINQKLGGVAQPDGKMVPVRILLLAGADLIQTMSTPGVWSQDDLEHILGGYGVFVVERNGTDVDDALASLQRWKDNIYVIQQLINNDISSTKIRMFLRREMSIQYLIPAPVVEYIEQNALYEDDDATSTSGKGKAKGEVSGRGSPAVGGSSSST